MQFQPLLYIYYSAVVMSVLILVHILKPFPMYLPCILCKDVRYLGFTTKSIFRNLFAFQINVFFFKNVITSFNSSVGIICDIPGDMLKMYLCDFILEIKHLYYFQTQQGTSDPERDISKNVFIWLQIANSSYMLQCTLTA